jgi:hypothetical protein
VPRASFPWKDRPGFKLLLLSRKQNNSTGRMQSKGGQDWPEQVNMGVDRCQLKSNQPDGYAPLESSRQGSRSRVPRSTDSSAILTCSLTT